MSELDHSASGKNLEGDAPDAQGEYRTSCRGQQCISGFMTRAVTNFIAQLGQVLSYLLDDLIMAHVDAFSQSLWMNAAAVTITMISPPAATKG